MEQAFFLTLTLCGFMLLGWMLVKQFILTLKWYYTDLMLTAILCSIPMALMARSVEQSGKELTFLYMLFICCMTVLCDAPILIGSWWGLRAATTLKEERTLMRLLLILTGQLFVGGSIAWCYSALKIMSSVLYHDQTDLIIFGASFVVGLLLFLPGFLIELRCRKLARAELAARVEHSRAAFRRRKEMKGQASDNEASSS